MRVSADPSETARAADGRAPDVFHAGGWVPMRQYRDDEDVDFAIVGTGAGGGTLACKLAEYGFSVVALDAGPYWRPLEDFASDEYEQSKLYWTTSPSSTGTILFSLAPTIPANRSAGRPCISPWCRCGFVPSGSRRAPSSAMARTGRRLARDMELLRRSRAGANSGPVNYPWGPKRPRYPYRPHELNAAALVLAQVAKPWASIGRKHRWQRSRPLAVIRRLAFIGACA